MFYDWSPVGYVYFHLCTCQTYYTFIFKLLYTVLIVFHCVGLIAL